MLDPSKVLVGVPAGLREPLLNSYQEIATNFAEHRWEPSELNGGKLCEVVSTIVSGYIKGAFPQQPSKPRNMVDACRSLETEKPNPSRVGDRSVRILIPRALQTLYEIRSNRGVGHAGADVDANFMDATVVYSVSSWVLAEMIRIFHGVTTKEAQETVDALVERKIGLVWEVEEIRRILDPKMNKTDQTVVLLYSKPAWVPEKDLLRWVEYSNLSMFRKVVLQPLHVDRLIEYDATQRRARISPLGCRHVEEQILKTRTT